MTKTGHLKETQEEQFAKKDLLRKCYSYLRDNFHKFKQEKQIKIALELVKKDLPNKVEGEGLQTIVKNIVKYDTSSNKSVPTS